MKNEFKDIGKKMPYSVPDGFFEAITLVTLEKARKRAKTARKRKLIFQWLAAAAVMTGVIFTGIRLLDSPEDQFSPVAAGNPLEIQSQDGITKPGSGLTTANKNMTVDSEKISAESVKSVDSEESVDELLASIPDEELMEWASQMHNDPFSDETENNTYHENN